MIIVIGTIFCSLVVCACAYVYYEMFIKKVSAVPFEIIETDPNTYIIDVHPKEHEKYNLYDIITGKGMTQLDNTYKTYVTYKHKGSTYKVCLESKELKELKKVKKELKHCHQIIYAYLYNEITKGHKDITDVIKMFQGPNYDFHKEVYHASSIIDNIIDDKHLWTHLVLDDINGDEVIITIHDPIS
jgi:hypothetical protein